MKQKITMSKVTNLSTNDAFELFIRKCRVKNLSEKTINIYEVHYTKIFLKFWNGERAVSEINADVIDDYIMYLRNEGTVNDISINSYLRTIRAFIYYCQDCQYVQTFKIKLPKADKKIKETYTDAELERLLTKPDIRNCTFSEYKIWVFENYLLGTGNRISTALNLRIEDINFDNSTILLRKTKNRKQQIIPLSRTLSDILREYLEIRCGSSDEVVFPNSYGETANIRVYQDMIKRYNIRHNVNKSSAHLFRATFAKNWILAGGDMFRLQKILGHSSLDVTREYVNMFAQDLQMDFEKFNPLDNIKTKKQVIRMQ